MTVRGSAPVVVAVDDSSAGRAAVEEAINLAAELGVPLVFVHVRPGPAFIFGGPVYRRRLASELRRARRVLDRALGAAEAAGIDAEVEVLEGPPGRRIVEFARDRGALLVVVGSRRRRLGRSVSQAVARSGASPVVVAARRPSGVALARAA